jgi:LuxR family maltose regulon positive regulatory protein
MPKAAEHVLIYKQDQNSHWLYKNNNRDYAFLQGDSEQWFAWLADHTSFSFQGLHGHLNMLKEARKSGGKGEDGYWYAYRRQGKRTMKKYAGRTADLTMTCLETIARALTEMMTENAPTLVPPPLPPIQTPLLEPKLHLPRLHTNLVERERLLTLLDAVLERKLTLITAPPGFGKTTLLLQWLAHQKTPDPFAWVALDAGDNDPIRFWRYVLTACQSFQNDHGHEVLHQLSTIAPSPFEPSPLETILTTFLNALTRYAHDGILILEDYHLITSPSIHQTITFLLDHLPPTLHLILLSRSDPPLPLARLRARGDLCEIHTAELCFSQEETLTFLQQNLSLPSYTLSPQTIRQLDVHLEGWAAGLRLLTFALRGNKSQQEVEHILATFASNHPAQQPIQDYFITEVLDTQPEPLQHFLLQTSVLCRLTGSLCDSATDREDSEQLLDALEHAGLFLELLDGPGHWYRYHALFAETMQQEARRRLGMNVLREVSQKASQWYENHTMFSEAIESALQAQNLPFVAELLERTIGDQQFIFGSHYYEIHEFHTIRRWLEQIPAEIMRQHPALCLVYATALLFIFALSHLTPTMMMQVETFLQMAAEGWRAEGNMARLGEVFAFRALLSRQKGVTGEAVDYANLALALLPEKELAWRSAALNVKGTESLLAGYPDRAEQALLEANVLAKNIGNPYGIRATIAMLGGVYFEQGKLHEAAMRYRQVLHEAREQEDRDDIAHALLGLIHISYEWNDLSTAEQQAQEALELGELLADEAFQLQAALMLARIQNARGQTSTAQQCLDALLVGTCSAWPTAPKPEVPLHHSLILSRHTHEIQIMQASLHLAAGDTTVAQRWIKAQQQNDALHLVHREQDALLMVRLLMAQGKSQEALDMLISLHDAALKTKRTRTSLEIQILMARAYAVNDQLQEARHILHTVLMMTHAEGYLRLFLDEGEAMTTLLRGLVPYMREKHLMAYLQTILQAFARKQKGSVAPPVPFSSPLIEPLSSHEQRVLRLLVAGRTNPEIARELTVSVNTIRTQVQSIYRKLNVHNRFEASDIARQLQLL